MKYSDYFNHDNFLRHSPGRRKRSLLSAKIPPFRSHVVDVDYVEVDLQITDPAHLLPEHSMTPYYMEERRREDMFIGIVSLYEDIERLLRWFKQERLHMPRGSDKCPYLWESRLGDDIYYAFDELEEEIEDALSKFRKSTTQAAWHLYEAFGCSDAEYRRYLKDEAERIRLFDLRQDFIYDILHISVAGYTPDDDLPF